MKIVYVLNNGARAGASMAFKNILPGLLANGVYPIVIIPEKNELYDELLQNGIKAYMTRYKPNTYPRFDNITSVILFLPRIVARRIVNHIAVRRLCQELKNQEINIVHTNTSIIDIGYRIAKKLGIPHIYHIREYADEYFKHKLYPTDAVFTKHLLSPDTYSICITKDIQKHFHLDDKNYSTVIYDGVAHDESMSYIQEKEDFYIFVGRIEYGKGIDILIDSYIKAKAEQIELPHLIVIGNVNDIKLYQSLQTKIKLAGVTNDIDFKGELNNVTEYIRRAKAVIVPSRMEGFGLVTTEAMFCHSLVVGNDIGGTKEQFDNGLEMFNNEIGIRYHNGIELIDILKEIANKDISEYTSVIDLAYKTVSRLYTLESSVMSIISFYNKITYA
ncbi:MAG: glycosyltransferase [Prevotellaceae bacterium]|nr:glycosyltransferase [Candidatus Colivivens equi]